MRFASLIAFALLVLLCSTVPARAATIYVDDWNDDKLGAGTLTDPYRNLQDAINFAQSGDTIFIRAGRHIAEPVEIIDYICGNCPTWDVHKEIPAERGFHIAHKSLILVGESRKNTFLVTRAGYGVYFDHAGNSRLENLTVTGGVRDWHEDAISAAVVVRWTHLIIRNTDITDNTHYLDGEGAVYAGIAGLVGREGAVITAENLWIYNNSWDGIALYRGDPDIVNSGPRATINNVDIDLGDGVGIGVTWNAQADITNARVSRYWKGVGSFGGARVTLRNSIVRDQDAWGVLAYGTSHLTAINNTIAFQGRFGLGQWSTDATVIFKNNIVYENGKDPYRDDLGPRAGIWITNSSRATVQYNDSFANTFQNVCLSGNSGLYGCSQEHIFPGGNISVSPLFVNVIDDNYALRCGSPAINAGDPLLRDPDGTRSDMGAYGGPGSPLATSCFLPDLQPTKITGIPDNPEVGDVIRFASGVRNDSVSSSHYFNVRWFVDGREAGADPHAGVPANTTVADGAFSWTAAQGLHTIVFKVDADNHVNEGNEGNNSTSVTLFVQPRRPDLTPTPIAFIGTFKPGQRILFDSGVTNLKDVASGAFAVKWFVDDELVGHGGHVGVPGNTTVANDNSQYTWIAAPGKHKITFTVDTGSQVSESNEDNNSTWIMVNVP